MKRIFLHITIWATALLGSFGYLAAQEPTCYSSLRKQGLYLLSQERFDRSIDKFIAARFCLDKAPEDDLDQLIRQAQEAWVEKLQTAERSALEEAKKARREKERADTLLEIAKEEAKARMEEAEARKKEYIRAEASRLALQAENQMEIGRKRAALYLAFLAMQLTDSLPPPYVMFPFGHAVYENYDSTIFTTEEQILSVQALRFRPAVLLTLSNHSIVRVGLSGEMPPVQVAAHDKDIIGLTLSATEDKMLTFSSDRTVRLWNEAGQMLATCRGHEAEPLGATFSPDERKILSWGADKQAIIWNDSGQILVRLQGHTGSIYEGGFSPDGSKVFTRSSDGTARIWDTTGQMLACLDGHRAYVYSAGFSPDGRELLTASADSTMRFWGLSGEEHSSLSLPGGPAREARYAPGGSHILVWGPGGGPVVCNEKGQPIATLHHNAPVLGARFLSPDTIATWTAGYSVNTWNIQGAQLAQLKGHAAPIVSVEKAPKHPWILTTALNGYARLWDMAGHQVMPIELDSSNPVAAQFSAYQGQPVYIKGQHSLHTCPLPDVQYRKMKEHPEFKAKEKAVWKETFNLSDFVLGLVSDDDSTTKTR